MYRRAGEVFQDRGVALKRFATPLLMEKEVGVALRRGDVQPVQFARDPEPGFIEVHRLRLQQARHDLPLHRLGQFVPQRQRRFHRRAVQRVAVEVLEQLTDLLQWHFVLDRKLGDEGPHAGTILHGRRDLDRVLTPL